MQVHTVNSNGLTSNCHLAYFQRKIQSSRFSAYLDGLPSQLIWISGVLLYLHECLLTPWTRVLQKLTCFQLVNKLPMFYGTQRFIITFTSACNVPILSQLNPVHTPTSHFLKIHLKIILPSMLESPRWSPLKFSRQNSV